MGTEQPHTWALCWFCRAWVWLAWGPQRWLLGEAAGGLYHVWQSQSLMALKMDICLLRLGQLERLGMHLW